MVGISHHHSRVFPSSHYSEIEHDRDRTPIDAKAHNNSGDDNDNDDDSGDGCNRRRCACDLGGDPDMQRAVLTRPNNQHEVEGRKGGRRARQRGR